MESSEPTGARRPSPTSPVNGSDVEIHESAWTAPRSAPSTLSISHPASPRSPTDRWCSPAVEETGFAVAFGLCPVVGPAERLDVAVARGAAVGDRIDVIPLKAVAPITAVVAAHRTLERGRR